MVILFMSDSIFGIAFVKMVICVQITILVLVGFLAILTFRRWFYRPLALEIEQYIAVFLEEIYNIVQTYVHCASV